MSLKEQFEEFASDAQGKFLVALVVLALVSPLLFSLLF